MKNICACILLFSIAIGNTALFGQEKKSKKQREAEQAEMIKQLIGVQDYTFFGIDPPTGEEQTTYKLIVTKEEVAGVLPYFGFYLPHFKLDGGNIFNSKNFDYKIENTKKGGWDIYIKIEVEQGMYDTYLKVMSNGRASLMLINSKGGSKTIMGNIVKAQSILNLD